LRERLEPLPLRVDERGPLDEVLRRVAADRLLRQHDHGRAVCRRGTRELDHARHVARDRADRAVRARECDSDQPHDESLGPADLEAERRLLARQIRRALGARLADLRVLKAALALRRAARALALLGEVTAAHVAGRTALRARAVEARAVALTGGRARLVQRLAVEGHAASLGRRVAD